MSNKKRVNKRRRRSPWSKLFAKTETRLSARVTSEEDWQTDVPNIRLSRAFVIVLLMHLVVGGALVAFTLMNPNEAQAQVKTKPEATKEEAPATGDKKSEKNAAGAIAAADRTDDMRRHIVHSGDSVAKIAQQYGVTEEEIHAVNRIDELYQLYQGRVLRIPVSVNEPIEPGRASRFADKASGNGNNFVGAEQSRTKAAVPRAELVSSETKDEPQEEKIDDTPELLPETIKEVSKPIVVKETPREPERPEPKIVSPRKVEPERSKPPVVKQTAPVVKRTASATGSKTYTVVKGDTAFRIAKRYGVHYKDLLSHNGITDPSKLQIGQALRIPVN